MNDNPHNQIRCSAERCNRTTVIAMIVKVGSQIILASVTTLNFLVIVINERSCQIIHKTAAVKVIVSAISMSYLQ
jgi:hypothetical protein